MWLIVDILKLNKNYIKKIQKSNKFSFEASLDEMLLNIFVLNY